MARFGLGERECDNKKTPAALVARRSHEAIILLPSRSSRDHYLPARDSSARQEAALVTETHAGGFQCAYGGQKPASQRMGSQGGPAPKAVGHSKRTRFELHSAVCVQDGNGKR